jgi:hypothetical protein
MAPGLRIASSIDFLTDQAHLKVEERTLVIPANWERLALQSGIGGRLRPKSNTDDGKER